VLPKELIKRIRKLEITTRRVVTDTLAGQYHSVFKGRGMAFSEVRQYQPGDEIRAIDWNVTARMNEAYVKVFTEERELTVMIVVDVSASKEFGTRNFSKAEVAAEVAAQIAFSAIANNDRVGLILFSDRIEKLIPPKKGRKHVLRLVTEILAFKPVSKGTDLTQGLNALSSLAKRKTVTFLISDFLTSGYDTAVRIVARKHDLVPVAVMDPTEQELPALGLVEMEDPESGETFIVDTSDAAVRSAFRASTGAAREARTKLFRKLQLDSLELKVGDDHGMALARFFQMRARRQAA
jgi:uncharacterized protein (DUF58 family)